jgi:ABC-type nitrate/sulfonate/bicarbonate transport system substrate-binding protein
MHEPAALTRASAALTKGTSVKRFKLGAVLLSGALLLTACGDDSGDSGDGASSGGDSEVMSQVKMAIDGDDYMNQLAWMVADEKYWPDLGFSEPAEVVASDEYLAGLFGGDVWVAQGESDVIWSALAEGSVPMKIIGVEKGEEAWFLGIREGIDENDLEGLKVSGGAAGDRNITVGEKMLEELGVDPESMEWVSIEGGSDDRLSALTAGQIDVAVLQPRHVIPLEAAGGKMIFEDYKEAPQEVWVVTEETMQKERASVCAYLEGRIAAKQWISAGKDYKDNQDAALKVASDRDLEPAEGDLEEWAIEMEHNWALDGGSSEEAFDTWNQDMIDNGNVPEGFDWREHADLSCLTEVQEKLGLEPNPGDIA